jgi:UDP-N-acetylmuramyl-tripeptide synthetase
LNSSQIEEGDLFIAIPGTKVDGHDFIGDAINSGAIAVISNGRDVGRLSVPQIKVANPRRAASIVASEYYGHPTKDIIVLGITGTNGKTTTASLLYSSHALDQYRVADVEFDVALFTNLTPEHLDYHASIGAYYQAKARLFRMLPLESTAIVNESDPNGLRMAEETNAPTLTFSRSNGNSIHFSDLNISISGIHGKIIAGHITYDIGSSLVGEFNAENILGAVSVAHALGIEKEMIEEGIKKCSAIPGRMESFPLENGAKAIMDYAHTPDAYEKVLGTLKEVSLDGSCLYVVFGAGGDRDASKRPKMAQIAEIFATHCFVTPDNPRTEDPGQISKEIIGGFSGSNFTVFKDRGAGLEDALNRSEKNDIVVILGKGREEYQDVKSKKEFYSDLEIIRRYQ